MSEIGLVASELVDALGVAWTIHGLYPDPENQPAFGRAVSDVGRISSDEAVAVSVGPGAFIIDGEEFRTDRQAAERLAVRLYVHNVELLRFASVPEERDVVRLFNVLAREPEAVALSGGVTAALSRDGVTAFAVVERSALGDTGEGEEIERDSEVSTVMADGHDPEAFAESLMELAGDDPELAGKVVHERYHDVLARVSSDDATGREEVVRAFVEAFFHLPDRAQIRVLEQFLENQAVSDDQAFLDQFAGHELATMSTRLDTQAMSLLMDYANIVTDPEADARSVELLGLLEEAPTAVNSARQMIASHVAEKWGSMVDSSDAASQVPIEVPDHQRYFYTVLDVFRDLLAVEHRDERFGRLMRIWSGKVVGALRRGEFRRAELWLRAVRDNPTFDTSRSAAVEAALDALIRSAMVEQAVRFYPVLEDQTPVLRIMAIAGSGMADPLIEQLADAESAAQRRVLTEMVSVIAESDPDPVIEHIDDNRWFLVRNLAVALRRSGRAEAATAVRKLLEHEDYRVRVEAVRGVAVLEGDSGLDAVGAALGDSEDAVRAAALAVLGSHGGPEAERRIIDAFDSPALSADQRKRAIELLGRHPTPEALALLEKLAHRRFVLTGTARLVRDTARKALQSVTQGGTA